MLSGTFSVGTGDSFDPARLVDIPRDGFSLVPGRLQHFSVCKGDTDIVIYGTGPRLNHWIPDSGVGARAGVAHPHAR